MTHSISRLMLIVLSLAGLLAGCQQVENDAAETAVPSTTPPTATQPALTAASPTTTAVPSATTAPVTTASSPTPTNPAATTEPTPILPTATAVIARDGALIGVSMTSQVGVLLDDFPAAMRDRVATAVLDQSDEVWLARAARQVRLTRLRLNFRGFMHPGKGQLPLPPADQWQIELDPAGPARQTIQGHDLVMIGYTFSTTILTDAASPGVSEPALADVGGVWDEPFTFPADPDMLLQRTDNACINEGGFPPNSFDSENAWRFYDFDCTADSGGALGCHRTRLPNLSCQQALVSRIGAVETAVRFERLPWDNDLADQVRSGPVTSLETPDLMVVGDDLDTNRIIYRYIEPGDCAAEEGAVGDSGWRRLLQFDATVYNIGGESLHIGPAAAEDTENNVFTYSLCHDHFHYTNYGDFFLENLDELTGSKQAFCVQSTNRLSNNETSPLIHDYSCRFQGIQAGWVDEYIAGLDAQWIDITDMDVGAEGQAVQLGFRSNGDQFLCEGTPVVDDDGNAVWEASGYETDEGEPINRPQCQFIPGWDENNEATRSVFVPPTGGLVTAVCQNDEAGPLRNCGFQEMELTDADAACQPGDAVNLNLRTAADARPQTLRVCEWSAGLGTGVACTYEDSLANYIITPEDRAVTFTCPAVRDGDGETLEGRFSLYTAPVWPGDEPAEVEMENDGD